MELELLKLCQRSKLDDDDLLRLTQLVNGKEAAAADVNCIDDYTFKRTPLMLLCCYNQSDRLFNCVEILLHDPISTSIGWITTEAML